MEEKSIENKKKNNSTLIIIIIIIVFVVVLFLLAGVGVFLYTQFRNSPTINSTGHWYGKPSSVEDIKGITIVYNNGKDYIMITPDNVINYYTYDKDGNRIDNQITVDTAEIIQYVYDNDLDYLTDYDSVKDEKWSLRVDGSGRHCLISSNQTEPKWFQDLLKKLNVDEYGYLSNPKASDSSVAYISAAYAVELSKEQESYDFGSLHLDFNGTKVTEGEDLYHYLLKITYNGKEIKSDFFQQQDQYRIFSKNMAASFEIYKIDNVYIIDSEVAKQCFGNYVMVFNTEGDVLNTFSDVDFDIDKSIITIKSSDNGQCMVSDDEMKESKYEVKGQQLIEK